MKRVCGEYPFDKYWVYGPIFNKKDGRNVIILIPREGGKRTSLSYARYLMSIHLKRNLSRDEHVDHIDGNKINDCLENFQILSQGENTRKTMKERKIGKKWLLLKCPQCGKIFYQERNQTHIAKKGRFTSCSRACSGSIKRRIQLNRNVDLSSNILKEIVVAVGDNPPTPIP